MLSPLSRYPNFEEEGIQLGGSCFDAFYIFYGGALCVG